ncbi:MAG: UDP-N-acetylmuramoyl-L-alanine--D-glutamate ligase [Lachnospiraceae bacterium]|nr:UDP-N-acetylmuramoyl-L-alanine--D-glutamate ligase [Lachnospiraceae bacterium]
MNLNGKKVLVAGAGKSGLGSVALLQQKGASVILYDGNDKLNIQDLKDKLSNAENVNASMVEILLGDLPDEVCSNLELCVISPGIPLDVPFVEKLKKYNVNIWGEIELAYRSAKGKLVGITGTNGKTTTTALVGEIMKNYFESVFVVGNIGIPYALMADKTTDESVTVAEISSFQLETIEAFKPDVSAVLNITPDHLNRHKTMENYGKTKMKVAMNQESSSVCVLNYEDEALREYAKDLKCKPLFFSSKTKLEEGIYLDENNDIWCSYGDINKPLMNTSEMKLVGIHNAENVMAAMAMSIVMGVPLDVLVDTIKNFNAVEHRIEYVTEKNGVVYYNDSKGTNTDASIKALEAMSKKTVLIAGGYDKGSEFDEWVQAFKDKVKCLVLIGVTANKIAETARKYGFENIVFASTLKDAVIEASKAACEGEVVLLSPACASWDMFDSYEQRGDLFKEYVNEL